MASKLIKLTDSNGNILIPAVVSQAVQVKNGSEAVDLQTAYEGIQSLLALYSGLSASGLENALTYSSYISHTSNTASFTYYFINGNGKVKTNTVTINNVSNATNATNATNAEKLTTGKLTYTGSTGTLTYNFGNGDKNVIILGNANTYGFVKLGTGAGHAATGNHTHSISYEGSTGKITAGGSTTSTGIIASTTSYGFTKLDSTPKNGSNNTVPSTYIYNSYQYVREQLTNKAASDHTHDYSFDFITNGDLPIGGFEPTTDTISVISYFPTNSGRTQLVDGDMKSIVYNAASVPTKKYIDDNFVTQSEFETFSTSGMHYMGSTGTGTTFTPSNPKQGDVYIVGKAGHGNSNSELNDFIVYNGTSWDVWDKNVNHALYKGSNHFSQGEVVVVSNANGEVKSVSNPSLSVVANSSQGSTIYPAIIRYSFNRMTVNLPIYGYNGGIATVGTAPGIEAYIGISYTPDHTGSGTAGKLLYWETATKHSAITSTYGYNNQNNMRLMHVENGVLQNMTKSSGSSSIPTYVAEGYIRPVSSIDSALYYNDSYVILNGSNQSSTVSGANVAADTNLIYLHASSSNYKDTPIKIIGTKGIRVSSQDSGKTLNIEQNFMQAEVISSVSLAHSTYYYESTDVTVDDFTLYNFSTSKKYLEGLNSNSVLAYVKSGSR